MSVYVDNMKAGFGRMKMCHMVADSREELLAMADAIRVQRKWMQSVGTHREHFDICMTKRALAVSLGAREISSKELGRWLVDRRKRAFLRAHGWSLWYRDDYWVNPKTVMRPAEQDYTNYGMGTDRAYQYETENEGPFPPLMEGIIYGRQGKNFTPATSKSATADEM